ncbi:MAG: hypothetical protein MI923_16290 [Phycisphaerales bacterium]|nr:hypothetical protein [Phycisphaerales bacterium]
MSSPKTASKGPDSNSPDVTEARKRLNERAKSIDDRILIHVDDIFERTKRGNDGRIELNEDGSVSNVAVLRETSRNNRNYSAVMEQAAKLFDGATVYLRHDDRGGTRTASEICGKVSGLRVEEDQHGKVVKADKLTPIGAGAKVLTETIQSASDRVGLSIEASGAGTSDSQGCFHVKKLTRSHGVAIVPNPGTTNTLFESADPLNETIISDQIEADEKLEKLRKIVSAATGMMHDVTSTWREQFKNLTMSQRVGRLRAITAALLVELNNFEPDPETDANTSEQEGLAMKAEDIKKLTEEELREHNPDLWTAIQSQSEDGLRKKVKDLQEELDKEKKARAEAESTLTESQKTQQRQNKLLEIRKAVLEEAKLPARITTVAFMDDLMERDYSPYTDEDGALDEEKVKAKMMALCEDRKAIAGSATSGPTLPPIQEVSPVPSLGAENDKPISESLDDEKIEQLVLG